MELSNILKNKKISGRVVIVLFILGFILRLYRFNFPIADWHSWRQADTSSVSKIFANDGFDVLHPRYLDISNIQTGKDNPEGYRFVEFPLYNIFQAGLFRFIGIFTIEEWGRLVSIASSLLTGFFLYLLTKKYYGQNAGIFTLSFYLFLPFSIYYGRTILPDTSMIMTSVGSIYFFDKYLSIKSRKKFFILVLSAVFGLSSLLLKPYAIFFLLPIVYLSFMDYKFRIFLRLDLWIYAVASILPLILWRLWISNFPEGVPVNLWLLNGNGIRFRPAFFRWIFYERITKLILGYSGAIFILLGVFNFNRIKNKFFALSFVVSSALYVSIFATGNVQHDYYQILIIPSVALVCGLGLDFALKQRREIKLVAIVILLSSFYFSFNQVKDYFNINNEAMVRAGKTADKLLPKNAKVIAPFGGDTTFLYHINRPGWPAFQADTEELIKLGATHMVLLDPTESHLMTFGKKYKILSYTKDYLILALK